MLTDNSNQVSISANGISTIAQGLASGSSYSISVTGQPLSPAQHCTVANGSGVIGSSNVTNVIVTCATPTFQISATISGLTGSGLVLADNGADLLTVTANGIVSFKTAVASGASYDVTVKTQPTNPAQICSVSDGSGKVGSSIVTSVSITCHTSITNDNAESIAILGARTAESLLQLSSFAGELLTICRRIPLRKSFSNAPTRPLRRTGPRPMRSRITTRAAPYRRATP